MPRPAPDGLAFDIAFDIAFALIRALKIPKAVSRIRREITEDERRMMAQAIAAHLALANWRIEKGPPAPAHSAPEGWSPHAQD